MKKRITAVTVVLLLSFSACNLFSQVSKDELSKMTPADALTKLKEGNERFVSNSMKQRDWAANVKAASGGQNPFAVIVSCMDSRTSCEIMFDQGMGDIFSNRVAGNIVNEDIIGGLEYACKVVGSKLVVVLGHTECGAVKGAIDHVELGNLTLLLDKIEPSVNSVKYEGERNSHNHEFLSLVTKENVILAIDEIRKKSPILKEMEDKGEIRIAGGLYDISTGKVIFYE